MKKSLIEIGNDLTDVTDAVSTQVRALTLGVLAIAWLGLSGSDEIKALHMSGSWQLMAIAALCIITLFVDLLQYQFGYAHVYKTLRAAEKAKLKETSYNTNDRLYVLRMRCFYSKQAIAVIPAVWLVIFVAAKLMHSQENPNAAAAIATSPVADHVPTARAIPVPTPHVSEAPASVAPPVGKGPAPGRPGAKPSSAAPAATPKPGSDG